ncbi:MAG: L-ribulose-5-phosphate 4-epimerase [Chloroflexota bacterium]
MLQELRKSVWHANLALPAQGLVSWTSGNASGRDPETNLMVIKPSGVLFEDLTPEDLVVVDMNGKVIEGNYGPSSDTATHLWIYRNRPDVHGIVHTHSNYATAFAAVNKPIPPVLTAIADEFGGPIPVGGYASIGGKEIGEEILRSIGDSCAILMKNHGVFTIGKSVEKALKTAVMTEDAAKTVWLALQIGEPDELSPEEVAANYDRYSNRYGTSDASIIDF